MSTTTLTVVNGVLPTRQDAVDETAEFEKILKLRDEIFAGNHPRLTVPAHLLRKLSSSPASSSPSSLLVQAKSQQPAPAPAPAPASVPGLSMTQNGDQLSRTVSQSSQPAPTLSGIHPALLTKSDDLIRAELALQRQRLEKQLRDQFEQKRLDFRKRPAPAEAKPEFDISSLLAQALESVKPISLSKAESGKEDENDSFDENSFYSSRAPDSTPERAVRSISSHEDPADESVLDNTQTSVNQLRDTTAKNVQLAKGKASANPSKRPKPHNMNVDNDDDDEEEGEYSPPEADHYPAQNANSSRAPADPRGGQMHRLPDKDQNSRKPASPSESTMRIDRQHANSNQSGRAASRSKSPDNVTSRNKRRKVERKAEKRSSKRNIKTENVSPPPFHDIQPLGANKLPQPHDRTIIIDEPPMPQEIQYVPAPQYVESPLRPMSRQEDTLHLASPRIMSRNAMRPREDQDLRRVASMHNMRLEQPREYVDYTPVRQRATSYVRVDSPMREVVRDYPSDVERPLQEVRVIRTPAPEYREIYQPEPEVRYIPEPMPPPPRERIVVDQYGRRFREVIQERPAVAPRPSSYLPQDEPQYYDPATPMRTGSVMMEERTPLIRYETDMLPPRQLRQVDNTALPISVNREFYEPGSGGRAGSVAVYDRPPRQVMYAESPGEPRQTTRMSSVRPHGPTYDEQPFVYTQPRTASVRPMAPQSRERGMIVDDSAPLRPEYMPMEQSQLRYRVAEPETGQHSQPQLQMQPRYIVSQGREPLSLHQEDGVRYVQRY